MASPSCNSVSPVGRVSPSCISSGSYAPAVRAAGPLSPPLRRAKPRLAVPRLVVTNMSASYHQASGYRPTRDAAASSLYGVLGVEQDVSASEIKSAYRQMVRRYHPDVSAGSDKDSSTQMFLRIQEAYEVLMDPYRRADYDYNIMHPFCAQALEKESRDNKPWLYRRPRQHGQVQHEVSPAWKLQWAAQINRLKQRQSHSRSTTESWGARMRQSTAQRTAEPAYSEN